MSSSPVHRPESESDLEYDHEFMADGDDDDWWDAEDQTQPSTISVHTETNGALVHPRNQLNEADLRKKMLEIQKDDTIHPKEKARMMQVFPKKHFHRVFENHV